MPSIDEVVDVAISVQSSAVAQVGFDSVLIAGDGGPDGGPDVDFNAGFSEYEVRKYTSLTALTDDVDIKPQSSVVNMATVLFSQVPAVSDVYVSRIDQSTPTTQVSTLSYQTGPFISGQDIETFINGASIGSESFATDNNALMDDLASLIEGETEVTTAVASIVGGGTEKNTITITGAVNGESFTVTSEVQTSGVVDEVVVQVITNAATDLITGADISAILATNSDWFGYVHSFASNADARTAAVTLAASRKVSMFLFKSVSSIPALNTNYASSWYTESSDATGQWLQAAAISAMLGREVGSYNPSHLQLSSVDAAVNLTASNEASLRTGFANQYTELAGINATYDGRAGNGGWIDTYINVAWLTARIQEDVVALLLSQDKVPYDDEGIALIGSTLTKRLQIAENMGVIASVPKYVVTLPLASTIPATDKSNRILNGVSFVAYTAPGINQIKITGTLID